MRLLVWTGFYVPEVGGIETLCAQMLPRLVERGHEVTVITGIGPAGGDEVEEIDGVAVHRLALREALTSGSPADVIAARRTVADLRQEVSADVVHFHLSGPEAFFELATRARTPAPLLLTLHNQGPSLGLGGEDTLYDRALSAADRVTAVSPAALDEARRAVAGLADRSLVVPNPVDVPDDAPWPLPPTDGRRVVAMIGRLVPQKGVDVALGAVATLRAGGHDVVLEVAGDGTERAGLEARADELGLAESVVWHGNLAVDVLAELRRRAAVVVMPSRFEGLPMAALEALAVGRPLVATPVGGLADLVVDGESGLLVPVEDPDALAAAIAGILADADRAERLAAGATDRARAWGSVRRCVDAYEALYEELLAEGSG